MSENTNSAGQESIRLVANGDSIALVDSDGVETAVPFWALCRAAADFEAGRSTSKDALTKLLETPVGWEKDGDSGIALTLNGSRKACCWDDICAEAGVSHPDSAIEALNALYQPTDSLARDARFIAVIGSIAGALAKALAGKVGGLIGAKIFDAIFPPKDQNIATYFDDMYNKIVAMFDKRLAEAKIHSINGHINGTQAFMRNSYPGYNPGSSNSIDWLKGMVLQFSTPMYTDVTYTLAQPDVREPGFPAFLLAVGVHLALLQELAVLDRHGGNSVAAAQSAEAVKKQAADYLKMVQDTWKIVLEKRLSYLKTHQQIAPAFYPGHQPIFLLGYVIDEFISTSLTPQSMLWGTSNMYEFENDRGRKLNEFKVSVTKSFSESLAGTGGVEKFCEELALLQQQPLPPV